jgi:hypothetical protein
VPLTFAATLCLFAPSSAASKTERRVDSDPDLPHSAAELLADWRGAKRDSAAATTAAEVATLALEAAQAADEAASETEAAALAAAASVEQALRAASSAKRAAAHAARAAQILLASAEGDKARAHHDVEETQEAEEAAGKRFHTAEQRGFPRDPA